jgi:two-component system response regulator VicR
MNRLLLVEDDMATCVAISSFFGHEFEILVKNNGFDFLDTIKEFKPHLILLDINLPGPNGLKLLSAMKSQSREIPVFIITIRSGEEEMLKAFQLGASDYITKPFSLKVLEARIRRWIQKKNSEAAIQIGSAIVDLAGARVTIGESKTDLTQKEVLVLRYLIVNSGQILSREQFLDYAWGYDFEGTSRTVDNVILSLRKKLGDTNDRQALIQSHRGLGYCLNLP